VIGWIGLIAGFISAGSILTGNYVMAGATFALAVVCGIIQVLKDR
jgi:hypothetical protein